MGKPKPTSHKRPRAQHRQPIRHTDAAFSEDETGAFFLGVTIPVRSEDMRETWYDDEQGRLYVQFHDGSVYNTAADDYLLESFARASSKGGWWWDHVIRTGKEALRVI